MSSGCPICGFDGRQLSPSDAAVALRSFPRRFKLVLARPDDEDRPDDVLHRRPKDGGLSAIEHAAWVARGIGEADGAFRSVMYQDDPAITLPDLDGAAPVAGGTVTRGAEATDPPDAVVAGIKTAGDRLADAVDNAPGDGWERTGRTPAGPVSALDVVRLAVHLGVHHLRLAEKTVADAAHDLG